MGFKTIISKKYSVDKNFKNMVPPVVIPAVDTSKKKRRNKKPVINYKPYLFRVLKKVHREIGISAKAMEIMNSFIIDMLEKISQEASKLARYNKKKTLSCREIETAVKLVIQGELAMNATYEGTKAVETFNSS